MKHINNFVIKTLQALETAIAQRFVEVANDSTDGRVLNQVLDHIEDAEYFVEIGEVELYAACVRLILYKLRTYAEESVIEQLKTKLLAEKRTGS